MQQKPLYVGMIDDNQAFLNIVSSEIERFGHKTRTFNDVDALLDVVEAKPETFDVLIADRYLGHQNLVDLEFSRACRDYGFAGPIMLMSSVATPREIKHPELYGFEIVMKKVVDSDWNSIFEKAFKLRKKSAGADTDA